VQAPLALCHHLLEETLVGSNEPVHVKFGKHAGASGGAKRTALGRIEEKVHQGLTECFHISRWNQHTRHSVLNLLRQTTHSRTDHGAFTSHGLKHCVRQVVTQGGTHENVRGGIKHSQLADGYAAQRADTRMIRHYPLTRHRQPRIRNARQHVAHEGLSPPKQSFASIEADSIAAEGTVENYQFVALKAKAFPRLGVCPE